MPGFNRTGPMGAGSMTGGARGLFNPKNAERDPRFTEGFIYGRGLGLRRGFGCGFGRDRIRGRTFGRVCGWYPPPFGAGYLADTADEIDMLTAEADYLQKSLNAVNKRMEALKKQPPEQS